MKVIRAPPGVDVDAEGEGGAHGPPDGRDDVSVTDGVEYARALVGGANPSMRPLLLDVYQPEGARTGESRPAVVAATDDAIAALDYVESHVGELGIEPSRISLIGSSAGAITADHVAYVAPAHGIEVVGVRSVGSLWGGVLIGPPPGVEGAEAVQMTAQGPPLWSIHGDADPAVPFQLDDELIARAAALGVPHEFYRVAGGTHGYGGAGLFTVDVGDGETPLDRLVTFVSSHSG